MNGGFRELRGRLAEQLQPHGADLHLFEGFEGTGGAGADVTVKAEIDLDDDQGDDVCVLNEQRTCADGEQAAEAIRELAATVVNYRFTGLLA